MKKNELVAEIKKREQELEGLRSVLSNIGNEVKYRFVYKTQSCKTYVSDNYYKDEEEFAKKNVSICNYIKLEWTKKEFAC